MAKFNFYSKPSIKKIESLSALYYAFDYLIVTCPNDLNPMTNTGYNFWDWGVIKIDNIEIPAPHKEYGITSSGRKVTLTSEQSAIINTAIWLERLLSFYSAHKSGTDVMSVVGPMGMYQLKPAFDYIDRKGVTKIVKLIDTLKLKCYDDDTMYAMID